MPGVAKFVSSQPQYSALWRAPEAEVIPLCERNGIIADRVVAARPGRADRQVPAGREAPPADSRAAEQDDEPLHQAVARRRRRSRRCSALRPIADEAGLTLSQLALAWVLQQRERRRRDHRRHAAPSRCTRTSRRPDVQLSRRHAAAIDDRRVAQNSGGVVSSGSIRQPPSGPRWRARARRSPPRASAAASRRRRRATPRRDPARLGALGIARDASAGSTSTR